MTGEKRAAITARLAELADRNAGRLTPDDVVADARSADSPLHDLFEWNIKKAAYSHWLDRAREIITSVRVSVTTEHTQVKVVAYVRDPAASSEEQGYRSIVSLRANEEEARAAIVAEFTRVGSHLQRAREIAVALDLDSEVEEIMDRVTNLKQIVMGTPTATM